VAITEPSANRGRLAESIKTLRGQMLLLAEFDGCMVECDGRLCDAEREVGVQNPHRGGASLFCIKISGKGEVFETIQCSVMFIT